MTGVWQIFIQTFDHTWYINIAKSNQWKILISKGWNQKNMGKNVGKKKKKSKQTLTCSLTFKNTSNENWVKVTKVMCLRNKTPKIRAILKLSGICLSYLYGCVAKWVRDRDDHTNTVHILILYSAILYSLWRLGIPSNWWLPHQGYDCRYIILWQMVSFLYEVCYNAQLLSKKDQGREQQDRVRLWSGNIW